MAAPAAAAWQPPVPAPAGWPTQAQLNNFTYLETMRNISLHPALTVRFFQWGLRPGGFWANHQQFLTQIDVVTWHEAETGIAPLAVPLQAAMVTANYAAHNWPIEYLIQNNKADCLRMLLTAGYWQPLGYSVTGRTYLKLARDHQSWDVIEEIINNARRDYHFAVSHPTPRALTGDPILSTTHFDCLLNGGHERDYPLMRDWWKRLHNLRTIPNPDYTHLNQQSRQFLCRHANRSFANFLLNNNGLNLAVTPMPPGFLGSIWHLALGNNNADFISFLRARNAQPSINLLAGAMVSPLSTAEVQQKERHYVRLLHANADATMPFRTKTGGLPVIDKWIRHLSKHLSDINPGPPGGSTNQHLYLHTIVSRLNTEITAIRNNDTKTAAQKARERRVKVRRVIALIRLVRKGGRHGMPDLTTRDDTPPNGLTALALAQSFGLRALYRELRVPAPVAGGGGGGGGAAGGGGGGGGGAPVVANDGHRYNTRRAARLRGN
ncbi:hypothetical protein BJX70DRAFT_394558 [Aspergillus crustosus]